MPLIVRAPPETKLPAVTLFVTVKDLAMLSEPANVDEPMPESTRLPTKVKLPVEAKVLNVVPAPLRINNESTPAAPDARIVNLPSVAPVPTDFKIKLALLPLVRLTDRSPEILAVERASKAPEILASLGTMK